MNKKTSKEKKSSSPKINEFPIVGIGASAGGLEALEQFFKKMPKDTGMAFVIVQHLDPNHTGMMPELLQRITEMKVHQVTDRLKVKPNCVYIIPPNKNMSLLNGTLHLFNLLETEGMRLPIDIFFRSLAEDKREKSIGIILSGMGSDGSLGLKSIKEVNGTILVQDPSNAKFNSMPRSAIDAVNPEIIAPVEELPEKLINYLNFPSIFKTDIEIETKNQSNLEKIVILLREYSNHDFSLYKKNTLIRRIERRMNIHQIEKMRDYVKFLQKNPKEVEILGKEMLIGVTNFFRDPKVWQILKEKVIPEYLDKLPEGHTLRAWVNGCSTGEEAYSLAIIFKEILEKNNKYKNFKLKIYATDIDNDSIDKARKGLFLSNITTDVSPERIKKFFALEGELYHINPSIREMVVFATQDVIKDPPFTKLDILTCRNLLIYLEPSLQKKLISLFNYCLNPGGLLLLGTSETIGVNKKGFEEIHNKSKIFRQNSSLQLIDQIDFPNSHNKFRTSEIKHKTISKPSENIQEIADQILLQRFSPPSVLINQNGDIIYITGHTGKYLEPVAGKANWNIHVMARGQLRNELPNAIRKAKENFEAIKLENIQVGSNGNTQNVDVTVQSIEEPGVLKGLIMIVFTENTCEVISEQSKPKTSKQNSTEREKKLELDLKKANENLQSLHEEMQTSQEELQSTNEELQSTNEELQSTNEELTTSKEEMQSLNEELQTVNLELQTKVNDSYKTNNDLKNLLNSTEISILFLDKHLNIRRFTDSLTSIFKLRNSDIGRPFTELSNDLEYPEMVSHAEKVLKNLTPIETEITTKDKRWFEVRIMPYRTMDDRIDGLVITFNDITVAKKLEIELKEANEKLRNE